MTLRSEAKNEKLVTETSHVIDVSPYISQLDAYACGEYVVSKVKLDNLQIEIEFYPKGTHKSKANWCSLFVTIPNVKQNDKRKLRCCFSLRNNAAINTEPFHKEMVDTVNSKTSRFRTGTGYKSFINVETLKQNAHLTITFTLYHDASFISTTTDRFERQLLQMYTLSRNNGDIVLSVNISDSAHALALYEPPSKKRRITIDDTNTNNESQDTQVHTLRCSSLILQSGSTVFNRMLSNRMLEKKEKKITIYARSVQDVDDMIYFMATNRLRQTANVMNIMDLAHFYAMERLEMACLNRMLKYLSVSTFVDVVTIFDRFGIKHGYNTLVEFGKQNLDQIRALSNFSDLSHSFKCIVFGLAKD